MKKLLTILALMGFILTAYSQDIKVKRIKKLKIGEEAYFPDFGSNNREILLTGENRTGLVLFHRWWKTQKTISKAKGTISEVQVQDNGNIIFTETRIQNGRRVEKQKIYNRNTKSISSYEGTIENKVDSKGKKIVLTLKGEKREFSPCGDRFYIWTSLSPDKTKILFTASGDGTYVSDLEGNIVAELGYLNAPEWINNSWAVGMNDKDDGKKIISSDIIAIHLDSGEKVNLTKDQDMIAQYPEVSPDHKKIIFHNLNGEIYLARLKIKN